MKAARVLIVMPVYNEGRHLVRVLQSLAAQTFDRERMYFVAVDGNSDDETHRILESWFETSRMPGCIAVNPRRKISASLNVGLRYAADDDIVARVDAHTVYGPTYIADAVGVLERSDGDVGCVGCAYVPVPAKTFGESLVQALYTNPMGLGGADYRFGGDVREVDSAYLGVWRAQVLKRAGGFNETLDANEDADISARIRSMGYRVLRVPLPCRFIINRTPLATIRQWHKYGYWRAKMLRRHPRYIRARHAVSLVMALAALALAASPLRLALVPIFALYAALVVRYRPAGEAPAVTLASLVYFPALQFAFAAGLVRGLLSL
jgi:glycosyltransferase involved in cell wall biosynthesis